MAQVKRAATFPGRGDGAGNLPGEVSEGGCGHDLRSVRGGADAGLPVRPLWGVVALAGGGAV
ncbi:hypothetical protein JCM10550A_20480 [Methanogenium cariaci]